MMCHFRAFILLRLSFFITLLAMPALGHANVHELTHGELRDAVISQDVVETVQLIAQIEELTGGEVVEIRAFKFDQIVTFRVIVRQADGYVRPVIVDGRTGDALTPDSHLALKIKALAK